MDNLESNDTEFLAQINKLTKEYIHHLESCHLRDGVRVVLALSRIGNLYFQVNQPWVLVKNPETRSRAGVVIGIAANVVGLIALLISPYMPAIGQDIWVNQCHLNLDKFTLLSFIKNQYHLCKLLPAGHTIGKPVPLFRKIEPDEIAKLSKAYSGQPDIKTLN